MAKTKKEINKYVDDYKKEKYDRLVILSPKGTKERINRIPRYESVNAFVNSAIVEKLAREKEEAASRFVNDVIETFEKTWTAKKWDSLTDERKDEFIRGAAVAVADEITKRNGGHK